MSHVGGRTPYLKQTTLTTPLDPDFFLLEIFKYNNTLFMKEQIYNALWHTDVSVVLA